MGNVRSLAMWVFGSFVMATMGAEDVVIGPDSNFSAVVGSSHAKMERTGKSLVFTDIAYDMQIACRTPPIDPMQMVAFEFRYRATPTPRNSGGELFYAVPGSSFGDSHKWGIPPLVRDGEWHVMKLTVSNVVNIADWRSSGMINRFRFDPTNVEGGRLEISEIRFRMFSANEEDGAAASAVEKFGDEDVWPELRVETFKSAAPKLDFGEPVKVACRGGTALPRVQTAGRKVHLRYDLRGPVPKCATLPVKMAIFGMDGTLKWSETLALPLETAVVRMFDDVWALEFDYELPLYIGGGEVTVSCQSPCLMVISGSTPTAKLRIRRIERDPDWSEPMRSSVVDVGGTPCFAVGGKPVYPLWGTIAYGRRQGRQAARHSSAPLNFVTVWTKHLEWWPRGEEFDPTDLDRLAEQHRRAHPGAYFMWDISIYPPPDWRAANPGEMARDEQGEINLDCGDSEINFSFASQKAYADMERILAKVIDHLEHSPYADRIVGYRVNSGHTVEWLGWDPTRRETILDFSPVAQKGFEAFAKAHYPWVTDYSVPTLAERRALDGGDVLWDQRVHARTIAYHDFYSTAVADGAIRMCRRAKELVGGNKLVGTYYGYVMTLNGGGCNQMRAHYSLKHLLNAKAVDFLMSPQNYSAWSRQPGSQICDMKPFRTLQLNGVVSAIEDDTRTHNILPVGYSQTVNEAITVAMLRRNMGVSLCRNQPFYTYAITSGCEFDFPRFADDAAALAAAGARSVANRTARAAEIAVVVSEEAIKSTPMLHTGATEYYVGRKRQLYDRNGKVTRHSQLGGRQNASWPYVDFYDETSRIGAGVDFLLAEDLADHPGDYKLYIFNSCTKLTPQLMRAAAKLRERNCTLLWTFAPGYTANDGNSCANMKALTGLDFELRRDVTDPGVTLADGTKTGSLSYPDAKRPLSPLFAVVNPERVLGRYANGAVGLGASRTGKATSIFSGSYFLEAPLLQRLAREAGVHLFSESFDVTEANAAFVSLHIRASGTKTVRLPRKTTVVDVFNRRVVAKDVDKFSFVAPLHSSWLFHYADDAEKLLED